MNKTRIPSYQSVALGGAGVPVFGSDDPLATFNFYTGAYRKLDYVMQGTIITYNPGTHSAAVQVNGVQSIWTCVFADELLSYSFGFSETHPPKEGELVLVAPWAPETNSGVIIGRIPYALRFVKPKGDLYKDPDGYHRQAYTQNRGTWDRTIPCFMEPLLNPNDDSTHVATHFRPTDVYPGEFAHLNQHNCGIKGGLFSATLLGGGASLRMSALTNMARLTCDTYKRHTMHGNVHEFHNGRYLSSERDYAMYQEERLGGEKISDNRVWTDDAEAPSAGEGQTIRSRIRDLTGFFGNLTARFCLRPDSNGKGEGLKTMGKGPEEGVSRETVDPSGQYRLSAAGMIAIERTGRIPVPVRSANPMENHHEIAEQHSPNGNEEDADFVNGTPGVLTPFEHSTQDPSYRQLELFDRQAYDLKNQYARVDGLGAPVKDYSVPQEEDLEPLKDSYDRKFFNNRTVLLEKYDKRRAGMYIGEDGSIIIRDAWGSEVVMLGGNVTISCAGNVMMLPGKTQLTVAGDDIVQKAQNSVDIHASEHDVRLSAARNMEIVGGGDEDKYSGGVIIEARGKSAAIWDGTGNNKGESAILSGITLRTKNQGVVIDGDLLNLRSKRDTRIISGDKDLGGHISVAAKTIRTIAKTTVIAGAPKEEDTDADKARSKIRDLLSKTDTGGFGEGFDENKLAAITVSQKSVMTVAESIGLFADKSLAGTKGTKVPVPMKWVDVDRNVAEEARGYLVDAMENLADEKRASAGYDRESLEKMVFNFRTTAQCGTNTSWNIGGGNVFKMYEPAWIQAMKKFDTLVKGHVDVKAYKEDAKWKNGMPWPGEAALDNAKYAQLVGLAPYNLTDDGFNRSRGKVKDKSDIEEKNLAESYLVRK